MSASNPVAKIPRQASTTATTSKLIRTTSSNLLDHVEGKLPPTSSEGRSRRIATPSSQTPSSAGETSVQTTGSSQRHPKAHTVYPLASIFDAFKTDQFFRVTDTLYLSEVWAQPIALDPAKGVYTTAHFRQIVVAPHIKWREMDQKVHVDDMLLMLYAIAKIAGNAFDGYDKWYAEEVAKFITVHGTEDQTNRVMIANYILREDPDFRLFDETEFTNEKGESIAKHYFGFFIRKIHYHSHPYPNGDDDGGYTKFENPSMVKCPATKGDSEYIIEARSIPLPAKGDELFVNRKTLPESQMV